MEDPIIKGHIWATGSLADVISAPLGETSLNAGGAEACIHFWLIETPNGPTSQGICKLCGTRQEFRNSVYSSPWYKGSAK